MTINHKPYKKTQYITKIKMLLKLSLNFTIFLIFLLTPIPVMDSVLPFQIECSKEYLYGVPYEEVIKEIALRYDLEVELVIALCEVESNFRNEAVSGAGAIGIMQIHGGLYRRLGMSLQDIKDLRRNIETGCWYIRYLTNRYGMEYNKVLRYYYLGEGKYQENYHREDVIKYVIKVLERVRYWRERKYEHTKCLLVFK